jgi:hypothetical protein
MLISCLAYISTLKIQAIYPSEAPLAFHRATEDTTLHRDIHDITQSCYKLVLLSDL